MVEFGDFATVALGQKTLLNDFFHLSAEVRSRFGIEDRFTKPLYLLDDLDPSAYYQTQSTATSVFDCRELPQDLRGTGAGEYVSWGARQTTGGKKQAGNRVKWPDSAAMRLKKHWYWPTEPLKLGSIALRKGIGEVYAPFLFVDPVAFDQRLYVIEAKAPLSDELVAAYMSSSLFALALEVNADLGLGGGVLSIGTRALRALPVPDLSRLAQEPHRSAILTALAKLVSGAPPKASEYVSSREIGELDAAILAAVGVDPSRAPELEAEVATQAAARRGIQQARKKAQITTQDVNVAVVAGNVAERLRRWLAPRGWPDDSISEEDGTRMTLPAGPLEVAFDTIMGQTRLVIRRDNGDVLLNAEYPQLAAEVIVRALLLGRRSFMATDDHDVAEAALLDLRGILRELVAEFDAAIAATGVGPRFEREVRSRSLELAGIQLDELFVDIEAGELRVR